MRKPSTSPTIQSRAIPSTFAAFVVLLVALSSWRQRWLISGAPILQFVILLGASEGYRVLPIFGLWTLFSTLNLVYAVASTSWLLYGVFAAFCYPAIVLACIFQFSYVSDILRKALRKVLKELHFLNDKIAFFDIPGLEIDTEVDGLMALRGITFSLSTLSFVVHGVEVGIKLSDDMELAIQVEEVTVKLFRSIDISDCFANIKGGEFEMTFHRLGESSSDSDGDPILVTDTPLLRAATFAGLEAESLHEAHEAKKMTEVLTDGAPPEDSSFKEGLASVTPMSPDNEEAFGRYRQTLEALEKSNTIYRSRLAAKKLADREQNDIDKHDLNAIRATICAKMQGEPSVPHPPSRSIKVTTLQHLMPLEIRRFIHRLPMLLRLLLNPLSYFHPVKIASITATGSGHWIESMLMEHLFEDLASTDTEVRKLKEKICRWLCDAKFAIELGEITGFAQVPFIPTYNINCSLQVDDVMAYRALLKEEHLRQVIRLGGADATFQIPSFLLPHHEHLLPPVPTSEDKQELEKDIEQADGIPKTVQAERSLIQAHKDEANVVFSAHARLPAVFDQELLDFAASLVKALKVIELENEPGAFDEEIRGIKEFGRALKGGMKDGMKKKALDVVVSDRWIAKIVGKIMRKMETAQGDLGYKGDLPVKLGLYRNVEEVRAEGEKLLP